MGVKSPIINGKAEVKRAIAQSARMCPVRTLGSHWSGMPPFFTSPWGSNQELLTSPKKCPYFDYGVSVIVN